MPYSPYFTTTRLMRRHQGLYKAAKNTQVARPVLLDTSELDFEQSLDAMKQIIAQKIG